MTWCAANVLTPPGAKGSQEPPSSYTHCSGQKKAVAQSAERSHALAPHRARGVRGIKRGGVTWEHGARWKEMPALSCACCCAHTLCLCLSVSPSLCLSLCSMHNCTVTNASLGRDWYQRTVGMCEMLRCALVAQLLLRITNEVIISGMTGSFIFLP